ncbi:MULTISPECIES: type II toxin-antitoxin system YafQ family toxin [Bifidobacterium]
MNLEVRASDEYLLDYRRLVRKHRDTAREIRRIVEEELSETGHVGDDLHPHVLGNSGGVYNGCMEFHAPGNDDVLVLYSPARPHRMVRLRRICTHAELSSGVFEREWPDD